jgi:hypothetical protein
MRIVFQCHAGGLGDSLLYSSLPKRWKQMGHEVFIKDGFRNPDIRKMWEDNPYVSGIVDEPHTHIMSDDNRLAELCTFYGNSIRGAEAYFGIEPATDYPEIYFDLSQVNACIGKTLIDYNAITAPFSKDQIEQYLAQLIKRKLFYVDEAIIIRPPNTDLPFESLNIFGNYEVPILSIGNLQNYANAIYTCKNFVTVSSGASALASGLIARADKNGYIRPNVRCLIHQAIWNKHIWKWNNLDYYITGKTHEDYADF